MLCSVTVGGKKNLLFLAFDLRTVFIASFIKGMFFEVGSSHTHCFSPENILNLGRY